MSWSISAKTLTGKVIIVQVPNPEVANYLHSMNEIAWLPVNVQSSSVFDVKKLIEQKDASLPHYLQRLVIQSGGKRCVYIQSRQYIIQCSVSIVLQYTRRVRLEESKTIAEAGLCNNSIILLIVMTPFELYIQDMNGRQHTIIVPSSVPEV